MVPYQGWRDALRPKSLRWLGLDARSTTPESTVPRALHQPGETVAPRRSGWGLEYKPQSFLDQILDLAATQRRLRLRPAVKSVGNLDGGLHRAGLRRHKIVKPYLWGSRPKSQLAWRRPIKVKQVKKNAFADPNLSFGAAWRTTFADCT